MIYHQKSYSQELNPENLNGYLSVNINYIDSVYVAINDDFDSVFKIASGDTLTLETGITKLRFIKKYYLDLVTTVEIEDGETERLGIQMEPVRGRKMLSHWSSYPRLFWEANNFILSDPGTELFVNGEYAGSHFARLDTVGTFEVTGIHSSGSTFTKTFSASAEIPFHFHEKYVKPSRATAWSLSFLPGGSQLYKRQLLKAAAFTVVTLGGATLAYSYESRYQNSMDEFNMLNDQYKAARNPLDAIQLGLETENAYNNSVNLSKTRNRIIYGTALVYLINIVDGFMAPSIGFRDSKKDIDPYFDFDPIYRQPVVGVKTSF
jgi:hypothetical protein